MRIVIATGIYPPEIGGHSYYTKRLAEELAAQGHSVQLVLYGNLKRLPTGVRHLLYTFKLLWHTRGADGIIAFDTFSVAIPAAIVSRLSRVPTFNRAGGDFVWETYSERTRDAIPLPEFYAHRDRWNLKERFSFYLIRWALSRVHVVFTSNWMRDMWNSVYGFDRAQTHVIENAIEGKLDPHPYTRKNFLFYTRPIFLKNHELFRKAFMKVKQEYPDIELEEGVTSYTNLLEKMRSCYAVVLPSISEVTPNYIIDAIRCGKPFLLTKHSGYATRFKDYGVLVDPLSIEDMVRGTRELVREDTYKRFVDRSATFREVHTYADIAREYVALFSKREH